MSNFDTLRVLKSSRKKTHLTEQSNARKLFRMQQRSSRQTRVRVPALIKIGTREAAAKVAGGRLVAGIVSTIPKVLGEWCDSVAELRAAKTSTERLVIAERLAGKPLALPVADGAP
jgi:hypothetical protein